MFINMEITHMRKNGKSLALGHVILRRAWACCLSSEDFAYYKRVILDEKSRP